jgi:excisionase family DNA binding protein
VVDETDRASRLLLNSRQIALSIEEWTNLATQPLTLLQAADELGVHYMTVYRYVRTGRLPATRVGGTWHVAPADLELVRRVGHGGTRKRTTDRMPSRSRLQARLIAGDETGAWGLLEAALASDMTPEDVLLKLLAPTLRSIGLGWERGDLSIADEHRASAVAARLISRLGARFTRRGVKRGVVILAAPSGEHHAAPVAIAANLLRWRGFEVVELGADTPAEALADIMVREPDIVALGMACTTDAACRAAQRATAIVRRTSPDVPILLGGAAITDAEHARKLGADVFTGGQADEVVRAIEHLVDNGRVARGGESGPSGGTDM